MRVLLIEADRSFAKQTSDDLEIEGFQIHLCVLGEDGIDLARHYEYDAIIAGMSLPDLSGAAVIKRLRLAKMSSPILALTGEAAASSRIAALVLGADDCLSRPFDRVELVARLRALIRRAHAHPCPVIRTGNLEIDLEAREARVSGTRIHLTATEYRMLELLALRKGLTIPRGRMFESLYDGRDDPEDKIIDVFICKLRKKIAAANCGESYITTTWGDGYRLREPGNSYEKVRVGGDGRNVRRPGLDGRRAGTSAG